MVLLPKVFTNVILEKNFSKKTNYKPHINITSVSLSLSLSHTLALGHGFPCLTFPDRDFKLRSQLPSPLHSAPASHLPVGSPGPAALQSNTDTHMARQGSGAGQEKVSHQKATSVQFISVAQSCPTLCDPMNCSMPGLPVHHQLPEFTQSHVH